MIERMSVNQGEYYSLLVGGQTGITPMEISVGLLQRGEN